MLPAFTTQRPKDFSGPKAPRIEDKMDVDSYLAAVKDRIKAEYRAIPRNEYRSFPRSDLCL